MRPNMCEPVHIGRNALPLQRDGEGVSVTCSVEAVLVHPVMVATEEIRVVDEVAVWSLSHPVEYGVETYLAGS